MKPWNDETSIFNVISFSEQLDDFDFIMLEFLIIEIIGVLIIILSLKIFVIIIWVMNILQLLEYNGLIISLVVDVKYDPFYSTFYYYLVKHGRFY